MFVCDIFHSYSCLVAAGTPSGINPAVRKHKATPRRRKHKANGRKRFVCLVQGCPGEVVNLKRHFQNIHNDIPKFEVEEMIAASKQKPKRSYPVKKMCFSWLSMGRYKTR